MIRVLVAGVTTDLVADIADVLTSAGHEVARVAGFANAVEAVAIQQPALMIVEVRLGDFNGLHVLIRARASLPALRVILIDREFDPVLQLEAHRHGAIYLVEPINRDELLAHVSRVQDEIASPRRFARKRLAGVDLFAQVARENVRVLDLSYGGLRLEVADPCDVAAEIDVSVPGSGLTVRARPVWTSPAPSGRFWCGAELAESNPQAVSDWRKLVDSVSAA